MGLSQALISAISGLNANQSSLALVSANVANAGTAGYVRKTSNLVAVSGSGTGVSVRVASVQRELDAYVQRQLRVENSGASYATTRSQVLNQLQGVYGQPGSDSALETIYNNFTSSLQALSGSPDDVAARSSVVSSAQLLTQQLNSMTTSIQGLRGNAELGISDAVSQVNDALTNIAQLNTQLEATTKTDASAANMLDQRDAYIDKLSKLMDINVIKGDKNQLTIYTHTGIQLVSDKAGSISFSPQGSMSATTQWSADPNVRQVGTLTLTTANGSNVDLIQSHAIRSGSIAAYLQLRRRSMRSPPPCPAAYPIRRRPAPPSRPAAKAVSISISAGFRPATRLPSIIPTR